MEGRAKWAIDEASLEPLVVVPPAPQCQVCVVVPVRDEAEKLVYTLDALAHQIDLAGQPLDHKLYEVIVLANNCCDDSAGIARHFAQQHSKLKLHVVEIALPKSEAYIGRVRRMLMDEAYRRLTIGLHDGVIASTDGDTRVAKTWIAATLQEIRAGADAVGGRIITDPSDRATLDPYTRWCHLSEVSYRYLIAELESYLDPDPCDCWPRHYQHFGASLAVTTQMYKRVGGLPAVRSPEDVAFYQALLRVDARFRHSPAVRVVTSARQVGRAKNGLANQLSEWTVMGRKHQPFLVDSASTIEADLYARRQLRRLWQQSHLGKQLADNIAQSAANLRVDREWLEQELKHSQTFGLLLERTTMKQQKRQIHSSQVEIKQAIYDLRARLSYLRRPTKRPLDALEQVKPVLLCSLAQQMP